MTLRRLALTLLLLSALPTFALAQTSSATIPVVETGQKVWVTTAEGQVRGDVTELSPGFIELATKAGIKRIAMSDVATISKKDSNKEGFWIGAAVGCVAESLFAYEVGRIFISKEDRGGAVPALALMCVGGGLIWGGIGAWIDSRIEGQEIVYRKSDPKTTVRIAPQVALVGTKRVGIGGSITWR